VKEFQCVTFEHASSAAPQTYSADISPRDVTTVVFTTQLCFFPPWKEVIPFLSVQLKYANSPGCNDKVKVGTLATKKSLPSCCTGQSTRGSCRAANLPKSITVCMQIQLHTMHMQRR
jgi:hypothetical protein